MSEADSNTIAAAAKKRLRREARIRENYDRISANLSINDSKATRNPTRIIPDVAGFQILSKTEIKKDTKDIEKNAMFANPKDRNLVEEMDNLIERSMRPHCAAESSLMRKKRRLVNWVNHPESVEKDMTSCRNALLKAKNNLAKFEAEQEEWLTGFQTARRLLTDALKSSVEQNKRLKVDGAQLLNLCESECGYALRKKRALLPKDLVEELLKRQNAFTHVVDEYIALAKDSTAAPTATLTVEELQYPEDDTLIRNRFGKLHGAVLVGANAATDAPTTEGAAAMDVVKVKEEPLDASEECEMECISDIPLPYFDHETRQIIPVLETPAAAPSTAVEASQTGPRTRKRSGSFSAAIKLESSHPSTTDMETANDSEATGSNPGSATQFSQGNWSPPNADTARASTGKLLTEQDLVQLLFSVQEAVKLCEGMVADTEFMFQDRTAPIDDATILHSILQRRAAGSNTGDSVVKTEGTKTLRGAQSSSKGKSAQNTFIDSEEARTLAAPFLALSRTTENEWSAYIDALFDGLLAQGIVTRKGKKKGPEFLPMCADPRLRTARGVNLMLSPLSQFEDRMVGVLHKDTIYQARHAQGETTYVSTVELPVHLRRAEEEAMERLQLQSAAAIADVQLKRLRNNLKEMNKFAQEAQQSLRRAEQHYEVVTLEEAQDLRKMYKELVHYGIIPACPEDPPLSPITSNSASVAANLLQNSVFPGAANNKAGAKNSRAPVRNTSVTQAQKLPMSAPVSVPVDVLQAGAGTVSRVDSMGSECGTTGESVSGSEGKGTDDTAVEADSLKRKAPSAAAVASAPKRRR